MAGLHIIGCGAMGSLLSLIYYRSVGEPPYCIVRRGSQARLLREEGLIVVYGGRRHVVPVRASVGLESLQDYSRGDPVLVAVKSYDLPSVLTGLAGLGIRSGVGVLVNGVSMPLIAVESGVDAFLIVTDYGVTRASDNMVSVRGEGLLIMGYPSIVATHTVDPELPCRLALLLRSSGVDAWCTQRIGYYMWLKAAANAAINGVTSILGVENGYILEDPHARILAERLASQMALAARLSGVELSDWEAVGYALDVAGRTRRNKSSMLQDLEACRRSEADDIYGLAIRVLEENNLDPGALETVYLLVKSIEQGCLRCAKKSRLGES